MKDTRHIRQEAIQARYNGAGSTLAAIYVGDQIGNLIEALQAAPPPSYPHFLAIPIPDPAHPGHSIYHPGEFRP